MVIKKVLVSLLSIFFYYCGYSQHVQVFETSCYKLSIKIDTSNITDSNYATIYFTNKMHGTIFVPSNIRFNWIESSNYLNVYWGEEQVHTTPSIIKIAPGKTDSTLRVKFDNCNSVIYIITIKGNYRIAHRIAGFRDFYDYTTQKSIYYRYEIPWYLIMKKQTKN